MLEKGSQELEILMNRLIECNENEKKIITKISCQQEEINKTINIIQKFQQCLSEQYQMMSTLKENENVAKLNKKKIFQEIRNLDDEMQNVNEIDQSQLDSNKENRFSIHECQSKTANDNNEIPSTPAEVQLQFDGNNEIEVIRESPQPKRRKLIDYSDLNVIDLTDEGDPLAIRASQSQADNNVHNRQPLPKHKPVKQFPPRKRKELTDNAKSETIDLTDEGNPNEKCDRIMKLFASEIGIFSAGTGGSLRIHGWGNNTQSIPTGTTDDIHCFYIIKKKILLHTASQLILADWRPFWPNGNVLERNNNNSFQIVSDFKPESIIAVHRLVNHFQIALGNGEICTFDYTRNKLSNVFSWKLRLKSIITKLNQSVALTSDHRVYRSIDNGNPVEIKYLEGCQHISLSFNKQFVAIFPQTICWVNWKSCNIVKQTRIKVPIKSVFYSPLLLTVDVKNAIVTFQQGGQIRYPTGALVKEFPHNKEVTALSNVFFKKIYVAIDNEVHLLSRQPLQAA